MEYNKENRKKHYDENKEKYKIYSKAYREKHKDKIREINRQYRIKNSDKVKENAKKYRIKNYEKLIQQQKEYYYKVKRLNRESENKRLRELRQNQRKKIIEKYGSKCVCCGESQYEFLNIDHKNNDGAIHRKKMGGSSKIISWIIKNNYPDDFQILCFNCNLAKSIYGQCPHKKINMESEKYEGFENR